MATNGVIVLRGASIVGALVREDAAAAEAITPGHLIEFDTVGDLQKHATANGSAKRLIALSRDEIGKEITVAYAAGDTVKYAPLVSGCEYNMILAISQTIARGDALTSAGDGTLHAAAGTAADRIVAYAAEAVTTGGAATARIAVQAA